MEAGSWMVHPEYRNTYGGMRLARKIHGNPPEHLELAVIFGQTVCDHLTSQKLGKLIKGHYCALEVEYMPFVRSWNSAVKLVAVLLLKI